MTISKPKAHQLPSSGPPLTALPPELQLLILSHLPYPDLLALKHTDRHFYIQSPTTVKAKVAWLVSRHERNLKCPDRKCIMKTDATFCESGRGQVSWIMEVRRAHGECAAGQGGCEVVLGRTCGGGSTTRTLVGRGGLIRGGGVRWLRLESGITVWAILALLISLVINIWLMWGVRVGKYVELGAWGASIVDVDVGA